MKLAVAAFLVTKQLLTEKAVKMTPNGTQGGCQILVIFPFGAPVVTKVSRCTENMLPELQKSPFCIPKGAQVTPIVENFIQNEARKLVPNVEHPVNSSDW